MDNWQKMCIMHPKKGSIPIHKLSFKEAKRAVYDLSAGGARTLKENADIKTYANNLVIEYGNLRASLDACNWKYV